MKILNWFIWFPYRFYCGILIILGIKVKPQIGLFPIASQYDAPGFHHKRLFDCELIVDVAGRMWLEKVKIWDDQTKKKLIYQNIFKGELKNDARFQNHLFKIAKNPKRVRKVFTDNDKENDKRI